MKQHELFDKEMEAEIPTIQLHVPDKKMYESCLKDLNINYTKPSLVAIAEVLARLTTGCRVSIGDSLLQKSVEAVRRKPTTVQKSDLVSFIALFLTERNNLQLYLNSLPSSALIVFETIVRKGVISLRNVNKLTGEEWLEVDRGRFGFGNRIEVTVAHAYWFGIFSPTAIQYGSLDSGLYFECPLYLRQILMPVFLKKEEYEVDLLPELPVDAENSLIHFDVSDTIFRELAVLDGFKKQNMLVVNEKGRLSVTAARKIADKMKLQEFFSDHPGKIVTSIRAQQFIPYVALHWHSNSSDISKPEVMIKSMFDAILHYPTVLVPLLLPHISGLRAGEIKESNAMRALQMFFSELARFKEREWIPIEPLLINWKLTGGYSKFFSSYLLARMDLSNKLFDEKICWDEIEEELYDAYYRSFLFLIASLGIVELAYENVADESASPFSSLRYFRFTRLGLYCINRNESYKAPEVNEQEVAFELDDRNLIIRSIGEDNPYEALLYDMAESIGHHRFKVTPASLLKNCSTHTELLQRKDFFKRFICSELPEIWENFFHTLSMRYYPLIEQPIDKYVLYRIDANNKELLRILSVDAVIRKYSLRVEGYLLLIEKENLKEVLMQLKSYGYLL